MKTPILKPLGVLFHWEMDIHLKIEIKCLETESKRFSQVALYMWLIHLVWKRNLGIVRDEIHLTSLGCRFFTTSSISSNQCSIKYPQKTSWLHIQYSQNQKDLSKPRQIYQIKKTVDKHYSVLTGHLLLHCHALLVIIDELGHYLCPHVQDPSRKVLHRKPIAYHCSFPKGRVSLLEKCTATDNWSFVHQLPGRIRHMGTWIIPKLIITFHINQACVK